MWEFCQRELGRVEEGLAGGLIANIREIFREVVRIRKEEITIGVSPVELGALLRNVKWEAVPKASNRMAFAKIRKEHRQIVRKAESEPVKIVGLSIVEVEKENRVSKSKETDKDVKEENKVSKSKLVEKKDKASKSEVEVSENKVSEKSEKVAESKLIEKKDRASKSEAKISERKVLEKIEKVSKRKLVEKEDEASKNKDKMEKKCVSDERVKGEKLKEADAAKAGQEKALKDAEVAAKLKKEKEATAVKAKEEKEVVAQQKQEAHLSAKGCSTVGVQAGHNVHSKDGEAVKPDVVREAPEEEVLEVEDIVLKIEVRPIKFEDVKSDLAGVSEIWGKNALNFNRKPRTRKSNVDKRILNISQTGKESDMENGDLGDNMKHQSLQNNSKEQSCEIDNVVDPLVKGLKRNQQLYDEVKILKSQNKNLKLESKKLITSEAKKQTNLLKKTKTVENEKFELSNYDKSLEVSVSELRKELLEEDKSFEFEQQEINENPSTSVLSSSSLVNNEDRDESIKNIINGIIDSAVESTFRDIETTVKDILGDMVQNISDTSDLLDNGLKKDGTVDTAKLVDDKLTTAKLNKVEEATKLSLKRECSYRISRSPLAKRKKFETEELLTNDTDRWTKKEDNKLKERPDLDASEKCIGAVFLDLKNKIEVCNTEVKPKTFSVDEILTDILGAIVEENNFKSIYGSRHVDSIECGADGAVNNSSFPSFAFVKLAESKVEKCDTKYVKVTDAENALKAADNKENGRDGVGGSPTMKGETVDAKSVRPVFESLVRSDEKVRTGVFVAVSDMSKSASGAELMYSQEYKDKRDMCCLACEVDRGKGAQDLKQPGRLDIVGLGSLLERLPDDVSRVEEPDGHKLVINHKYAKEYETVKHMFHEKYRVDGGQEAGVIERPVILDTADRERYDLSQQSLTRVFQVEVPSKLKQQDMQRARAIYNKNQAGMVQEKSRDSWKCFPKWGCGVKIDCYSF